MSLTIMSLKEAREKGLTRPVSIRMPAAQADDLASMLADLHRSGVPAALVRVKAGVVCVHRKPGKKNLRPSWDFADQGNGPAPVVGKRRNSQINFNHA